MNGRLNDDGYAEMAQLTGHLFNGELGLGDLDFQTVDALALARYLVGGQLEEGRVDSWLRRPQKAFNGLSPETALTDGFPEERITVLRRAARICWPDRNIS